MQKIKIFFSFLLIFSLFFINSGGEINAQTEEQLNQEIEAKKKEAEELKKQAAIYQKNIKIKQSEALSLKNELSILDNQIAKAELDVKTANIEINQTQIEIRNKELQIMEKQDIIDRQKNKLQELIQKINQNGQADTIKVFLLHDKLSDYFQESEQTKELQKGLSDALRNVKQQKIAMSEEKKELENKQIQLFALQENLKLLKEEMTGQIKYKGNLLTQTRLSEQKFTDLYQKAKAEQQQISNSLIALEKQARAKLEQQKATKQQLRDSALSWPIPQNKITSGFHDPDYPFRHLFEHPAIDIRAGQGTPIKAPAEGYVLKAKDAGMGYSYISLLHANGLSTVYGHVSKIFVKDDEYVAKGEVIGLTGGTPRTPGAGNLSTGPHLHFEVRLNGIPVNPEDYLP